MICDSKKVLFIHVPKCGGTFIEHGITPGIDWHARDEKHLSLAESVDLYGEARIGSYFKFAIVRNPFERLVSAYLYYRRMGFRPIVEHRYLRGFERVGVSSKLYSAFYLSSFHRFLRFVENNQGLREWAKRDLRPASEFIKASGSVSIDTVYRLEEIANWINQLGIKTQCQFLGSKINAAPKSYDFRAYYDNRSTDFVASHYEEDLAIYYPNFSL